MAHGHGSKKKGPKRAGDLVSAALRELGLPSRAVSTKLVRAWDLVCEPAWQSHTRVRAYEGGVLEIGVDSAPLREELVQYHQERLVGLVRTALTGLPVVALRFVMDEGQNDLGDAR